MFAYLKNWKSGLLVLSAAACTGLGAHEEKFAEFPPGTRMEVRLHNGVSTRFTQVGEAIGASVTQALRLNGDVLIPEGSVLRGNVTAISFDPPSLSLDFTEVRTADTSLPLSTHTTGARLIRHSEMRDEGKKIGGGAAAGAVLGGVLGGGVKGAAIGAAAGAAAGTGVALATKAHYADLPAGSILTVELAGPLRVPLQSEEAGAGIARAP